MQPWSRKRIETLLLALLAIASLVPLRFYVESRQWFVAEMATLVTVSAVAIVVQLSSGPREKLSRLVIPAAMLLGCTPIGFAIVARAFGSPIAFEMSALTVFGAVSLAMATSATTDRIRSLALILSGFLVLFCASISDDRFAIVFPLLWILICVWHLVANHWERLDLAMPAAVERHWALQPTVLVMMVLVLGATVFSIKDAVWKSNRLAGGFMPASGGSVWSDPAARDGVGTGDAAIAAKDHAESFGAVDSDLFLESTESTLFDMFNDMIGEPKKLRNKWERRQAMGNENMIPTHEQAAKSEQGGGTFSTERVPPKKHRHFDDASEDSVVQWDGPTGIRLAMHRYDTFDGHDWSQSADLKRDALTRVDINRASWFFDPVMRIFQRSNADATSVGLLKVLRLDSQRIPAPMMTVGVHIKDIDRQDFFGISRDGSFYMPGREKVPPLTVVHVASVKTMEDEIRTHLVAKSASRPVEKLDDRLAPSAASDLDALVRNATAHHSHPADQLNACVAILRNEFTLDRSVEQTATSVEQFLRTRRGGDHLFATTAALLARRLGLTSRLVTGFYVRPDAFDFAAGHASVLPRDVHVWAEVQLDDGRWIEIEPTPGYRAPVYSPSWGLLARRSAAASWPYFLIGTFVLAVGYLTRLTWMDWMLSAVWRFGRPLRPRRRIRLAIQIIEWRARLSGKRRPIGKSQRVWLEELTRADAMIADAARQFANSADTVFFGQVDETTMKAETRLVDLLHVRTITTLTKEATS
ncbi:Transglutaminase-like superfamily protein [Stieleria maiorica]|uniref:Transglutaminase-like superfamily protein n=1 Tax=Stieleria maiorica TaxID=2795974 RepID=A0A5B9MJE2_9BACT|nr:transglutaminase domain-containing protein [Stieleria maiorica]QEF99157.1 Transglutaminase-like superfamily protein [Stieleria maiorica]